MKKLTKGLSCVLVLMMVISSLAAVSLADEIPSYSVLDGTYVRLLGRGEVTDEGRTMNWPMSGIEFEFTGTKAEVQVVTSDKDDKSRARFNVSVDGGEPVRMMMYTGWNTICEGLEDGPHTVKFVRSSEGTDSKLSMTAIRTDSESAPSPTPEKARKIEFLGDSYACGYGNFPEEISDIKCAQNTDAWYAYPAITARYFDADANVIAVSGKGVCMNYATNVTEINDQNVMPEQFLSSDVKFGDEAHEDWDFSLYQPQVMVIFLGTNDYNGSVYDGVWEPGSNGEYFREKYIDMLQLIREKYPETNILCVTKPFQCYHEVVTDVVDELSETDDKLYNLVLDEFHADGVHGHPTAAQHEQTAQYIIDAIEAIPNVWGDETPDENDIVKVKENENGSISVYVNDEELSFDVAPVVINDRTLVPMRAIFEALGAQVDWNEDTQTATAVKDDVSIEVTIGGAIIRNDVQIPLDVSAMLISDRTMVPVRAVSESFGCIVEWEGYEVP